MFMNERHSGTAHITAALEAFAKTALISPENCVFDFENKFAASVTPATGEVSVMSGIMSWGGRITGIKTTESVSYTPPNSETLFKKVIVCAKYSKNTETFVESIQLTVLESENQSSESAANALTIDTGSGEITPATETAYFPLWSFVATSVSATEPKALFETIPGIAQINSILTAVNKALIQEVADRKTAVSNEASTRLNSYNTLVGYINDTNAAVAANTSDISNLKRKYKLLARNSNGIDSQTINQPITDFSMILIKCYVGAGTKNKYMIVPAFKMSDTGDDTNSYTVSEYNAVVTDKTVGYDISTHYITVEITVRSNSFIVRKSMGTSAAKITEIVGIY